MIQTMRQALRRWIVALIAVTILAAGGAAAYGLLTPPRYEASTQLLVGAGVTSAEDIKASQQLIGTYASLVVSPTALAEAATAVGGGVTAADIEHATDVQFSSPTRLLDLTVTLESPQASVAAASTLSSALIRATSQTSTSGAGSLKVTVDPQPATEPVPTNTVLRSVVAGVTAFVLGLLLALLLEQTRGVIRSRGDVEAATGNDPLVEFPRRAKTTGPVRHADAPTTAAYRMLAAYLDTLPPRPGAHCVAVVGTGADGRSQMPLNLAIALASTGRRALLLENESERPRSLAVFDTAPIDITGQAALYLFTPDPVGADFSVQRLGLTPETYQLALAWAESRSRAATAQAVEAAGAIADWVVLAPRSIESSDVGLSWAAASDAVLLVVEQGVTRRRELQAALSTLRRLTNQPIEVVLVPEGVREGRSTKATLKAIQDEARAAAAKRDAKAAMAQPPVSRPAQPLPVEPGSAAAGSQTLLPTTSDEPVARSESAGSPATAPPMPQLLAAHPTQPAEQQPVGRAGEAPGPGAQSVPTERPAGEPTPGLWAVTDQPRYRTVQPTLLPAVPPAAEPAGRPVPIPTSGPVANPAANPAGQQLAGQQLAGSWERPDTPVTLPDAGRPASVILPDSIFNPVRAPEPAAPAGPGPAATGPSAGPSPSAGPDAPAAQRTPGSQGGSPAAALPGPAPADRTPWTGAFVPPPVAGPDQANGRPRNGTPGRSR